MSIGVGMVARVLEQDRGVGSSGRPSGPGPTSLVRFSAGVVGLASLSLVRLALAGGSLNRVWAEDGTVFLSGALRHGFLGSIGTSYRGYQLLAPRLLTGLVVLFPIQTAGTVIAVLTAICVALLATFVFVASSALVPSRLARGAIALALVMLPVARVEVVGNLANLQWPLLFAAFWAVMLVDAPPALRRSGIVVAGLAALTCPISLVYVPIAGFKLAHARTRADRQIPVVLLAGCLAQFVVMVVAASQRTFGHPLHSPLQIIWQYFRWTLPGSIAWPDRLTPSTGTIVFSALILVTLVALGLSHARAAIRRYDKALLAIGCSVATFAAPVYLSGTTTRYVYVPALFVISAVAMLLPDRGVTPLAVVAILLGVWTLSLPATSYRVSGPTWTQSVRAAAGDCRSTHPTVAVPVAPVTDGQPWGYARIPCTRIPVEVQPPK